MPEPEQLSLISTVGAITLAWLEQALRQAGAATADDHLLSAEPTPIGEGKIGSNIRFALAWATGPSATAPPLSVVAKLPSPDEASKMTGASLGIYLREVRFYQELAAGLRSSVPRCYAALIDEATSDFVILMEDLSESKVGDQLRGCSLQDAEAAIDELAVLHDSYWGATFPEWLPASMSGSADLLAEFVPPLVPFFAEKYAGRLDEEVLGVIARFAEVMPQWGRAASDAPDTLIHGDYRLDNLLFARDGSVAAVDWQTAAHGSPGGDLAYFIGAGLTEETRRRGEAEQQLIARYHQRLTDLGQRDWSLDDLRANYRANTLTGIIMAVIPAVMVTENERSFEMFATMAERHARHALDWQALQLFQ